MADKRKPKRKADTAKGNDPEAKPAPRKLNPSQKPKLGQRVYDRKRSAITGRPVGRPRTDDSLKLILLGCLRKGLFLSTAMEIAGVGPSVVQRWREEPPDETGMDFRLEMSMARGQPKLVASDALFKQIRKGDTKAISYYLSNRTKEYGKEGGGENAMDGARQLREFINQAQSERVGTADMSELENWDEEDDEFEDDDDE